MASSQIDLKQQIAEVNVVVADPVVEVEDAVDRAMRHRHLEATRISFRRIGFWPGNRGGVGINTRQVHHVAGDIMFNKCRIQRYDHVDIAGVPEPMFSEFKWVNKARCDGDPLLPAFSPDMRYASVTKTHFIHACKLCSVGTHILRNEPGGALIRFPKDCSEGRNILEVGIMAVVYKAEIWKDPAAVEALCTLGNMNCYIEEEEDEIQAFGRIDAIMTRMASSPEWTKEGNMPVEDILEAQKNASGFGHFRMPNGSTLSLFAKVSRSTTRWY